MILLASSILIIVTRVCFKVTYWEGVYSEGLNFAVIRGQVGFSLWNEHFFIYFIQLLKTSDLL